MKKVLVSLCLALLVMQGCSFGDSTKSEYVDIKAEDIINEYSRGIELADGKYKGLKVKINGKLIRKGQFKDSSDFYAVISNKLANGRNLDLVIDYPVDKVEEFNKLKPGDYVMIKGVCIGAIPNSSPNDLNVRVIYGDISKEQISKYIVNYKMVPKEINKKNEVAVKIGIITGTEVRMRNTNDINGKILGHFNKGENVTVLEVTEKWIKVRRNNGQIGWVSNDFCSVQ